MKHIHNITCISFYTFLTTKTSIIKSVNLQYKNFETFAVVRYTNHNIDRFLIRNINTVYLTKCKIIIDRINNNTHNSTINNLKTLFNKITTWKRQLTK